MKSLTIILALVLSGCATNYYAKYDEQSDAFKTDLAICEAYAERFAGPLNGNIVRDQTHKCLARKGWIRQ